MINKAIIFDLDDTLLDRSNKAIEIMFSVIMEKCYSNANMSENQQKNMFYEFKKYDNRGRDRKTIDMINYIFDMFSPTFRIPESEIVEFWNSNFPKCFSRDIERIDIVRKLRECAKTAIITNGSVYMQNAKIKQTNLNELFEVIIISDEVGIQKPDSKIFELALNKLDVLPENTLFIGDHIEKDIGGSQSAGIRGIWFNPDNFKNNTNIKPFAEIHRFAEIIDFVK